MACAARSPRTPARRAAASATAAVCAIVVAACGAASFERQSGSKKYRQLPVGAVVKVVESVDSLPGPVEVLGALKTTTRGDPANRTEAEAWFKKNAAVYGCDAVSGLASARREIPIKSKTRTLGSDGVPKYVDEVKIVAEHDWTGQCVRSADAPPEAGTPTKVVAKAEPDPDPEPAPEPKVKPKKGKAEPKAKPEPKAEPKPEPKAEPKPEPKAEAKPEPKAEPKAEPKPDPKPEPRVEAKPEPKPDPRPEPRVEPKPEPKAEPKPEPKAEPKPEPKAEPKPEPKAEPKPEPKPWTGADKGEPPAPPPNPKLAVEVQKFFRQWSKFVMAGNGEALCGYLDETVAFDLSATQPRFKIKQQMTAAEACESLKSGELNSYLKEWGPAEVHKEVDYLLPLLFQLARGPFLKLDDDQARKLADDVNKTREAEKKAPLACTMYSAAPMSEDTFMIQLSCQGVTTFRLIVKRPAEGQFRVLRFNHTRP